MIRGGSDPLYSMASMPRDRMGLPPRSLAADAHSCIMVPIPLEWDRPNTRTWRSSLPPWAGSPQIVSALLAAGSDRHRLRGSRSEPAAVLGAVKEGLLE